MDDMNKKIESALKAPFSVKSWRDHRESAAKGSGVAKAISALADLGMDAKGTLKNVPDDKLKATYNGYVNILLPALKKAQSKCKRAHFTRNLCEAMIDEINRYGKDAKKRLAAIENKSKQEYAQKQLEERKKKEDAKSDKELAGVLKDMALQMGKLKTVFDNAADTMQKAHIDMKKVMQSEALKGPQKVNVLQNLYEKADKAYSKPVQSAGKLLNSNIKLRKSLGKVTKESDPNTQKMNEQFKKVVEVLSQSRAKAQSANSEVASFLAVAVKELEKNENARFASV